VTQRPYGLALLAAVVACTVPEALQAPDEACAPLPPDRVLIGEIGCAAWRISGGEGTYDDTLIATPSFRAVLRHPIASVGQAGLGGGTIVDAAAWGRSDVVHEIVPLVDGGWLLVDVFLPTDEGVIVEGVVRSLPSRPLPTEGQRRRLTWAVVDGGRGLRAIGADGFLVHFDEPVEPIDGWWVAGRTVLGHRGTVLRDEGGRIEVSGTDTLWFASTDDAWGLRGDPMQTVGGAAPDAERVEAWDAQSLRAVLPVVDGSFSGEVPATVTRLRAVAATRAPSPFAPAAEGLTLAVGAPGRVQITPAWDADARPITAQWRFADGRTGQDVLPPDGGILSLGAGRVALTVTAGPARPRRTLNLTLGPSATPTLGVDLRATWDPGLTVPVTLDWPASRDASVRDTATGRTREALAAGYVYAVQTARDDVPAVSQWLNDVPWIRTTAGLTLTHPSGWAITGWPARADGRRAAHGAPRASALSPDDASAALTDLGAVHRRANLAWLRAAGGLGPYPDRVALEPPGPAPFEAWAPWFDALNAYRFLLPDGPVTWLEVDDRVLPSPSALERAVTYGTLSTGDGAWVWLTVDGAPPGSVLSSGSPVAPSPTADTGAPSDEPLPRVATVSLHRLRPGIDTLWLWGPDGALGAVEVTTEDASLSAPIGDAAWVIGLATSSRTTDWAVTAPVFTSPDRRRPEGAPDDVPPPG
jgi:hypothetical protein